MSQSKWKHIADNAWQGNEVDWDEYESHRPPYTKALYELLFQHHDDNGGQRKVALDVGAGGGTVTRVLLEEFQQVIFSDPSEEYITKARKRFSKEADAGTMSFVQRKFDEFKLDEDLPNGQPVDMITAGTCIHFGDPAQIMAQLGPLLRSGGTIAAFSYGSVPIASPGEPAGPIIMKCKEKMIRWIHETVTPVDKKDGTGTGQARYNNVDFDPDMWKNVRRITSLPHEHVWPKWIEPAVSRVRDTESVEIVDDDFITKAVDFDFFPKYFYNFAPPLPLLDQIETELEELKDAMGDRKIVVRWPVMVIAATKR